MSRRLGIDDISHVINEGRFPAKSVFGAALPVTATMWREDNDSLSAAVVWTAPDGTESSVEMTFVDEGLDEYPEWFTTLPEGTIAYAENPPKRYEDIVPFNSDNDPDGLYAAICGVVEFWIGHGVRIFRVDNPHTKPANFWHRLIRDIKAQYPDVLFLAEAFTRPAMLTGRGVYSGFELGENTPVDYDILVFSKTDPATGDTVICLVTLNPANRMTTTVRLDSNIVTIDLSLAHVLSVTA